MRCYDGCPDSEMQASIDAKVKLHRRLAAKGMHATYFPMEGQWMVFRDLKPVTGFHDTLRAAASNALA